MGRRFAKYIIVLTLLTLSCFMVSAQPVVDTLSTSCASQVRYVINHPSCPTEANGSIELEILNAVEPVSLDWLEGTSGTSSYKSQLDQGSYEIEIVDGNNCTDTFTLVLVDPEIVEFDLLIENTCPGDTNGNVTIIPLTGNADSYAIDGGNPQESPLFENLEPGNHTIRVYDIAGCYYDEIIEVAEFETPEISISKEDVSCPGSADASFIVIIETVSNTEDFEYSLDGDNYLPDSVFNDLDTGFYEVYIRNESYCVFKDTVEIFSPEEPVIEIDPSDVSCPEGSDGSFIVIIETVSNAEPYLYSIDGDVYQTDTVFDTLTAGIYGLSVQDSFGCVFTDTVTITEPDVPVMDVEVEDVTCPGGSDGSFIVIIETVSNSEPYQYSIGGDVYQADSVFTDLEAGENEIFIQDTLGCTFSQLVEVEEPDAPVMDVEVEDVTCPGGSDGSFIVIIETVSNSEPYQYSIGGDVYQADSIFTELEAGVNEVFIQDTLGCTFSQLVEVAEPDAPVMDVEVEDVTCPGGSDGSFIVIIETVSNSEPYQYSIGGDVYQSDSIFTELEAGVNEVFIQDTLGCTFSQLVEVEEPEMPLIDFNVTDVTCPEGDDASFIVIIETVSNSAPYLYSIGGDIYQVDSTFEDLTADVYEVYVQDTFGCIFTEPVPVTDPDAPDIDFNINNVTCPDGSDGGFIVIIETVSNTEDFDYSLNGNEFVPDSIFTGLEAGAHTILIRNPQQCIFEEIVGINEPEAPELDFNITDVTCAGGTDATLIVIIETVSNSAPYYYSIDGDNYLPDSIFNDLEAGVYTVSVQDVFGCIETEMIEINEPDEVEIVLSSQQVVCNGDDNGIIMISASGPDGSFTYSLDGTNFQPDSIFNNLGPGIYEVTVKNGVGCLISENALITEPDLPEYSTIITDVSCNGGSDGSIEIEIISGLNPFEYALDLDTFQISNLFENLSAGSYTISLQDSTGCVFSTAADLSEPPPLNGHNSSENETCDYANGWIAVAVEGGTSPYDYQWSTGDTSSSVANLQEGIYYLSITDSRNCLLTDSVILENEPAPELEPVLNHLNCFEDGNGSIDLRILSQSPPFNIEWSNGEQSDEILDLGAGTYSVTVTDNNNCHTSSDFLLDQPEEILITGDVIAMEHIGKIDANVIGGVPPYNFLWSNGRTSEDLDNLPFGFYTLSVTDANGCESMKEFRLFDPSLPIDGSVNVYPTVTSDNVNVDIQLPEAKPVNIYLIDELGRLVQVYDPYLVDHQIINVDMEKLAAAVYFLRIDVDGEYIIRKVMKVLK